MPRPNEPIASSRAKLFVVPAGGGTPVLLGLVENFQATDNYTPEFFIGIGDFVPTESVINTAQGAFRWGRVHKLRRDVLRQIRPEVARYAEYESFDLLATDPKDNEPIARCVGCLPQMFETDMSNGRALRESYVGGCRFVQRGEEIKEAA